MRVYYTTSTVDSPEYKRLICGRTDDVAKLLGDVANGHSVAIFGERRIGKTSLLYLTRDIINTTIRSYKRELIDIGFKSAVPNLEAKVSACIAIYLNLQNLNPLEREAFSELIYNKVQNDTLIASCVRPGIFSTNSTLTETFGAVDGVLQTYNKRLIFLIDEVEILLEISDGKQIFRNLRGIIQSCPRISFVLAGAEYWHKQIKDRTSPIVNNVTTFYLKSPSRFAIENYLIKQSLSEYIYNSSRDVEVATQAILEWSNCKPYYVQAACQLVTDFYTINQQFSRGWKAEVEEQIEESVQIMLDYFYENNNLDNISKQILALLANYPGLTVKQISHKLGHSYKTVWSLIDDLESLEQVRKQGSEYYLVGKLIENWGKKTQDVKTINPWFQCFKWIFIMVLILLIPIIYFYTNPAPATFSCNLKNKVEVILELPKSIEINEEGKANITVKNTSSDPIKLLTITLESDNIEYQYEENKSSQLKLKDIEVKTTKYEAIKFISGKSNTGKTFKSNILVNIDNNKSYEICPFEVFVRPVPVKKYWALINSLLLIISGFLAKENLFKLAANLIPSLWETEK